MGPENRAGCAPMHQAGKSRSKRLFITHNINLECYMAKYSALALRPQENPSRAAPFFIRVSPRNPGLNNSAS
jgi:hypothetical protein